MGVNITKFLTKEECKIISNYILENETYIKSLGDDNYSGTSENSLTGRYKVFNYLHHIPGEILIPKIKNIFGECLVQCWANTFRKGEGIQIHRHSPVSKPRFICANIFLSGPNTGTYYPEVGTIISEIGTLSIFPANYDHGVQPNETDDVRISMALDIYTNPIDFNKIDKHPNRYILIK